MQRDGFEMNQQGRAIMAVTHTRALLLGALLLGAMLPCAGTASAQTVPPADASAPAAWRFSVTPYGWAPSVSGDLRYFPLNLPNGPSGAKVDVSSVNLIEALNFAAMFAAEMRFGRLSLASDFMYLDLGNSSSGVRSLDFAQFGTNPVSGSLNAGTQTSLRGSIWTLAGGYTLAQGNWGHVDAQAGLRVFNLSTSTSVRLALDVAGPAQGLTFARSGTLSRDALLTDAIIGARGRLNLGSGFHLPYAFDVGTGSSRLTWQAMGGIGYQTGWAGVTLGYRHLSYEQGGNALVRNIAFSGPYIALNLSF